MRAGADSRGFSLIELTVALGVFLLIAVFTAEVLVSYYGTLDVSHQRTEAMRNAVGVLNSMRAARDESEEAFPASVLAEFPQGAELKDAAESDDAKRVTSLPAEGLVITYISDEGRVLNDAELTQQDALRVKVTSRWKTLRGGRWAEASVQTILSNS